MAEGRSRGTLIRNSAEANAPGELNQGTRVCVLFGAAIAQPTVVCRERTRAMAGGQGWGGSVYVSASSQPDDQPPALQSPHRAISKRLSDSRLNPGLLGHNGNTKGCSSVSSTMLFGLCRSLGLARFPAELSNSGHWDGVALAIKTGPLRDLKSQTPKSLASLENSGLHIQLTC